jgi:hypothetical protein
MTRLASIVLLSLLAPLAALAGGLAEAIAARDLAGEYLLRFVDVDGLFLYRVAPAGPQPPADYNMLRHAGTMLALADYAEARPGRREAAVLSLRAAWARMEADAFGPIPGRDGCLAVWTGGGVPPDRHGPRVAKLGGAGLALAAGCRLRELDPAAAPIGGLRALGNGILAFREADGGFLSRIGEDGVPDLSWRSLYYPGEAALGLALLESQDPGGGWAVVGIGAMAALGRRLRGCPPPDHWALIAIGRLLPYAPEGSERDAMLGYAQAVAERMLSTGPERDCNPESTRMEGLASAHAYLPGLRGEIRMRLAEGAAMLVAAQFKIGLLAGGFPSSGLDPTVRIDNVQHALCALHGYVVLSGEDAR